MALRGSEGKGFLGRFVSWESQDDKGSTENAAQIPSLEQTDLASNTPDEEQHIDVQAHEPAPSSSEQNVDEEHVYGDEDLQYINSVDGLIEYIEARAQGGDYYMTPGERPFPFPKELLIEGIRAVVDGSERIDDFPEIHGIKEKLGELMRAQQMQEEEDGGDESVQREGEVPVAPEVVIEPRAEVEEAAPVSQEAESTVPVEEADPVNPELVQAKSPEHEGTSRIENSPFENIRDYQSLAEYLDHVGSIGFYSASNIKIAIRGFRKGELSLGGVPDIPGLRSLLGRLGSDPETLAHEDAMFSEQVRQAFGAAQETPNAEEHTESSLEAEKTVVPDTAAVLKAFGRTDTEHWSAAVIEGADGVKTEVPTARAEEDGPLSPEEVMRAFNEPPVRTPEEIAEADQYFKERGIDIDALAAERNEPESLVRFDVAEEILQKEATVDQSKTIEVVKEEDLYTTFGERFSITKEELDAIPGFNELALGQKHLVLRNLAENTLSRVQDAAREQYALDIAHEYGQKKILGSSFVGKVWLSLRESFVKEKHILEREQAKAAEQRVGGMAEHGTVLTQLVRGMREMGPSAAFAENGELVVSYVEPWEGITENGKRELELFNAIAHDHAKRPYEDGVARSREMLRREKEGHEGYERAKRYLFKSMEESGVPRDAILARIADVDAKVTMAQFMGTGEDALGVLGEIEDKKAWDAVVGSIATERGIYAASGYVARTALTGMLGFLAAPLVAAGVGGVKEWNRAKAELRERDRAQRRGGVDRAETALNVVTVGGERGALAKMQRMFSALDQVDVDIEVASRDMSWSQVKELQQKRTALLHSLRDRVDFTEDKLRLGLVNFGAQNALAEQYELVRELAQARVRLLDIEGDHAVRKRLEGFLAHKEEKVSAARRRYKIGRATEGALTAGGFALLGSLIGEVFGAKSGAGARIESVDEGVVDAVPAPAEDIVPATEVAPQSVPEVAAPVTEALVHEVRPGETLTSIMRTQLGNETDRFIGELKGFIARGDISTKEILDAGITSGNIDRIIPGESIDVSKLESLVRVVKQR